MKKAAHRQEATNLLAGLHERTSAVDSIVEAMRSSEQRDRLLDLLSSPIAQMAPEPIEKRLASLQKSLEQVLEFVEKDKSAEKQSGPGKRDLDQHEESEVSD
jgi:hypothetical protein